MNDIVSVIVTTKNEETNIENILYSINLQTYKKKEIILVDNYSTDKTIEKAKKFNIKLINHGKERSEQRNIGIRKSHGKYCLYLDADMILTPNLVTSLVKKIKQKKIKGIFIKEKIFGKTLLSRIRNYEREFYEKSSVDAIRFFDRDCFNKINGFDETITGQEDWDFSQRFQEKFHTGLLNFKIDKSLLFKNNNFYSKFINLKDLEYECIMHNETNMSLNEYINKKKYYIKTIEYYKKKNLHNSNLREQFSFSGRLKIFFSTKKNVKRIFLKPHKFLLVILIKIYVYLKADFKKI
jgi:glycosyltransferase involved in cell wall biosynthesis